MLGLLGAFASTGILFVLPPAIYLRLSPRSWRGNIGEQAFLAAGVAIGAVGLVNNAVDAAMIVRGGVS